MRKQTSNIFITLFSFIVGPNGLYGVQFKKEKPLIGLTKKNNI